MKTLLLINSSFEAKQAERYFGSSIIICLSLEAESYVKNVLPDYDNPLHKIIRLRFKRGDRSFYFSNFDIARKWSADSIFEYVQDSFGYFLTEFDRSFELMTLLIKKYRPKKIVLASQKDYKGFEVIHGNLDSATMTLLAKAEKLKIEYLKIKKNTINLRGMLGKIVTSSQKQKLTSLPDSDILVVGPAKHILQMSKLLKKLSEQVGVYPLTYGLDIDKRNQLRKIFPVVFEKERLIKSDIKGDAHRDFVKILDDRPWKKFHHPKYKNRKFVNSYLQGILQNIVLQELEPILVDMHLSQFVLSKLRLRGILTTTDPDTKVLPYIKTANSLGIKTIGLLHGADFTTIGPVYNPYSRNFIVWSDIVKDWAKDFMDPKILITGHSQFHSYTKPPKLPSSATRKQYNVLLLTTLNYFEHNVPYFLLKLFGTLEGVDQKILLNIRTHPFQPLENLIGAQRSSKVDVTWDTNNSLDKSIRKADVVIFENTTAGLDAMLFGKPAIYFNPYDGDDYFSMHKYGIPTILNESEIAPVVNHFFSNTAKWREYALRGHAFAKTYLGLSPDKDKRLANLITKLLKS